VKTTPYLTWNEMAVLVCLVAMPLRAQSLAGGYSDAVGFGAITPAVCTVSGASVTLAAVGTCTIHAVQPGNDDWAAATPVNQSFQVE